MNINENIIIPSFKKLGNSNRKILVKKMDRVNFLIKHQKN